MSQGKLKAQAHNILVCLEIMLTGSWVWISIKELKGNGIDSHLVLIKQTVT
jgi:hypothetical protein